PGDRLHTDVAKLSRESWTRCFGVVMIWSPRGSGIGMQNARIATPLLLVVAVLAALVSFTEPPSASGIIIPPRGVLIEVNTTSDLPTPSDGTCSLRAAISATNINGHAGNCDATGSQAGATDGITFNIGTGTPMIGINS